MTQHDLVVLELERRGCWTEGYKLKGVSVGKHFIGSEADTRLYELFGKNVTDAPFKETTREINGDTYTIETKKDGNRRVYRAYLSKKKPRQIVEQLPTGEVRITYA